MYLNNLNWKFLGKIVEERKENKKPEQEAKQRQEKHSIMCQAEARPRVWNGTCHEGHGPG